jgi:hypothetical protein
LFSSKTIALGENTNTKIWTKNLHNKRKEAYKNKGKTKRKKDRQTDRQAERKTQKSASTTLQL